MSQLGAAKDKTVMAIVNNLQFAYQLLLDSELKVPTYPVEQLLKAICLASAEHADWVACKGALGVPELNAGAETYNGFRLGKVPDASRASVQTIVYSEVAAHFVLGMPQ